MSDIRNYTHTVRFEEGGRQGTTRLSEKSNMGRKPFIRGKLGENVQNINFKSIAKVGLALRTSSMANELVGAYTGNKLRQRRFERNRTYATWAIGIAKFGVFGLGYAGTDLGFRIANHSIATDKKRREADVLRDASGSSARRGNRLGGNRV